MGKEFRLYSNSRQILFRLNPPRIICPIISYEYFVEMYVIQHTHLIQCINADCIVDISYSRYNPTSVGFINDWSVMLVLTYKSVRINPDNEIVTFGLCLTQQIKMPNMKEVISTLSIAYFTPPVSLTRCVSTNY